MRLISILAVTLALGLAVSACGRKNLPHPPPGYSNTQNENGYGNERNNSTPDNGTLEDGATDNGTVDGGPVDGGSVDGAGGGTH